MEIIEDIDALTVTIKCDCPKDFCWVYDVAVALWHLKTGQELEIENKRLKEMLNCYIRTYLI